jgi:ribonuclease HII
MAIAEQPQGLAGIDEVGRGALFGPVVAAAVLLTPGQAARLDQLGVQDSKALRPARRAVLAQSIRQEAVCVAIAYAGAAEIDRVNILQASLAAMGRAVRRLAMVPHLCLVDGNQPIPRLAYPQRTVIRGDQKEVAIAAASIVAKVWRDALIVRLDHRYPGYDLAANKGYGSERHRQALATLGPTYHHRRSFKTCQLTLPLSRRTSRD